MTSQWRVSQFTAKEAVWWVAQSQAEVALPRGPGSDEGIVAEPPDHDQNRFNVPVGECVDVLEDLEAGTKVSPVSERRIRSMTGVGGLEVSEGLVLDLSILSKGAAEIIDGVGDTQRRSRIPSTLQVSHVRIIT